MAKFGPGNTAGTGQNQFSPRAKSGTLSVSFDSARMGARARRVAGMAARADRPIRAAHVRLAEELQEYISYELEQSVRRHGRAQRKKSQTDRLSTAIRSPRNRRVNVDGYTVGYLDTIAAVRPYWRGLEVGSTRHVGRFLRGSFQNAAGNLVTPRQGGKDPRFLQFRAKTFDTLRQAIAAQQASGGSVRGIGRRVGASSDQRAKGILIKNPIVGYHYIERGTRFFISDGYTKEAAGEMYVAYLQRAGLGELAATLNRQDFRMKKSSRGLKGAPIGPPTPNPRAFPDDPI